MILKELNYALSEIAARRERAERKVENLKNTLYGDAKFLTLENEKGSLEFEVAKNTVYGVDCEELKKRLAEVDAERADYLKERGLTEASFLPEYTCKLCNDTGYVGKEKCSCLKNLLYANLRGRCGKTVTDVSDFSEISVDVYGENRAAYSTLIKKLDAYCESFPSALENLVFCGGVGVGKSYLAAVVSNRLMKRDFSVLFMNACELNQLFLRFHSAFSEDKAAIFEPLEECDLLVIDDLGSEPVYRNVTVNYLYYLLTVRQGKNTLITTNLSPFNPKTGENELMTRYEQRVFSRLADKQSSRIIQFIGKDLRV